MDLLEKILNIALPLEGGVLFAFFTAVFLTFLFEREKRPACLSLLAGFLLSLWFLLPFFLSFRYPAWISLTLSALLILSLFVLFLPFRGRIKYRIQNPRDRFDERNTILSRRTLVPGTERYVQYYARYPGNKPPDNQFLRKPGLLKAGTKYYDPILFAAANSIFEKVDELHPRVEGEPAAERIGVAEKIEGKPATDRIGVAERIDVSGNARRHARDEGKPATSQSEAIDRDQISETGKPNAEGSATDSTTIKTGSDPVTAENLSAMLLGMVLDWGAHSAGITELCDYHVYSAAWDCS